MYRLNFLIRLSLVLSLLLAVSTGLAAPASAKRYTFAAVESTKSTVTFSVGKLRSARVYGAQLRVARHRRLIAPRRVMRAARRGAIRLRLPSSARPLASAKRRARLVVRAVALPRSARRYEFRASARRGSTFVFQLPGLRSAAVYAAEVRLARYRGSLSRRKVSRGLSRGHVKVRLPRRVVRKARASLRQHKRRPTLIVYVARPAGRAVRGSGPGKPISGDPGGGTTSGGTKPTNDPPPAVGDTSPPAGGGSTLLPPGSPIVADTDAAARVQRSPWEPRPGNGAANVGVPTAAELESWRSVSNYRGVNRGLYYMGFVTGNFKGTTDEILQWGAWKWGFDADVLRAQAVTESSWYQDAVGDGGISYGILQLKSTVQKGTLPLSRDSTPFNVDYALMTLRHCYDGYATWLGNGYAAGDIWGCLGYYFSGRWYDEGARNYIESVKRRLAAREWTQAGF